jgi:hypothetical protein
VHEPTLIRTLAEREFFEQFKPLVKEYAVLPESFELIEDMGAYFEAYPTDKSVDWPKFEGWVYLTRHPHWTAAQRSTYDAIVSNVKAHDPDPLIINRLQELSTAIQVKDLADDVIMASGTGKLEQASELLSRYSTFMVDGGVDDPLAPYDLREIFDSLHRTGGLSWRLEELNVSVGPVCKGDLVIVAKRPEVGGTTFVTSEMTHMVSQLPEGGRAVLFNNEESKHKVMARLIQSGLNWTVMDMASDPDETLKQWSLLLGTRRIDVVHDTTLSTRTVEQVLKRHDYGLIAFNVLWKVKVNRRLEDYQKYEYLALWARQIADRHAPVLAVWQADASAEGVPWLNQSQLYGAKTAVQGEADVLLLIGKSHEPGKGDERYISVSKNKTPGTDKTDPKLRHGQFTVEMDAERGRFLTRMK